MIVLFMRMMSKSLSDKTYFISLNRLESEDIMNNIKLNTWEDMRVKYPEYREEMTEEREREFINDCFNMYEKEGFAKVFWSQGSDYKEYHNKPFKVLGRTTEQEADIECLPMWNIQFQDGFTTSAYPDEIIPREMIENGCKLEV